MKKLKSLNSRGFMLIETLLVSLTIAGILIYMYIQFSQITDSYQTVEKYNTVEGLFQADVVKQFLMVQTSIEYPNSAVKDALYVRVNTVNVNVILLWNGTSAGVTYGSPSFTTSANSFDTTINDSSPENPRKGAGRIDYYKELFVKLDMKYVLLAKADTTPEQIKTRFNGTSVYSNALERFMKTISPEPTPAGKYRIIIEYKDGSFATLVYEPVIDA